MKYFSKLFDTIDYDFDLDSLVTIRNIFKQYALEIENKEILKLEHIHANETLHEISYRLYGTTDYWWIIALLNDIKDWFEVYYNDNIFMGKAQLLAKQYFEDNKITDYTKEEFQAKYLEYYDKLKNEQRYTIVTIDPEYINDVIVQVIEKLK